MELQRNILIIALLAIGYFLFLAWQQDYGVNASSPAQPATTAVAPAAAPATPGDANPTAISASNSNADLAGLSPAASPAVPATTPEQTVPTNASRVVTVHTDVLDLKIDLAGGDIIELKLPHYPHSLKERDKPVQLMSTGVVTYIAQSGLVGAQGPDLADGTRAVYSAERDHFELSGNAENLEVVLHLPSRDGVTIDKVFRFKRGDYAIAMGYRVRNQGSNPWSGFLFGQIKRDGSGDPSNPGGGGFMSASPSGLGPVHASPEAVYNKNALKDVEEKPLKQTMKGGWIGFIQHYFVSAWVPPQDIENQYFTRRTAEGFYLFGFTMPQVQVTPGATKEIFTTFYAGPKDQARLKELSPGLDLTADYGWFWFIAQPLLWFLVQIESLVGNWGIAIILLTVLVKLAFFYPSKISYESMAHMRRVTPELTRIREEYKNDRQKQSQEMLALYRREKINPLGGCLPILLQMPVFIALYWVLLESVELRQAPFYLWITDLSVMDPYFILPILMGISMYVQTRLNPPPPDPMQAKIMQWMPWVFTLFFLFFSAGLVLYWLVNNLLSIAQQWYITRKIEKQHAKA